MQNNLVRMSPSKIAKFFSFSAIGAAGIPEEKYSGENAVLQR
jgi:hypothetical protein